MPGNQADLIRHALGVARSSGCSEVELSVGDLEFSAVLSPQAPRKKVSVSAVVDSVLEDDTKVITSPCVGYFKPAGTLLSEGAAVKKGDVVASIVALGLANDIESNCDGEIVEILVTPDQPVEFGQPIARVKVNV